MNRRPIAVIRRSIAAAFSDGKSIGGIVRCQCARTNVRTENCDQKTLSECLKG
jgi:hypothetical protein